MGKQVITPIWSQGALSTQKRKFTLMSVDLKNIKHTQEFELSKNTFLEDYKYFCNKLLIRF